MAATTTSTFSVGSNLPHGSKMSPLLQSKAPGAYCNFNKLRSFSGLKVATTSSCESELAFFGRDSRAALQASFPCKTQNQRQEYTASNQIKASFKVDVLGAAGGIGQPLALLIKMSPLVSTLHLYDVANVKGVATDLSHCNTPSQVLDFTGTPELASAFKGVDVVVIPAGVPRKPGMTRDELFNINANIVKTLVLT